MAKLKPPAWAPNAVPSPEGWRHPVTSELLKAQKIDMNEVTTPQPSQLNEAPANYKSLDEMDEVEIEVIEEQSGFFKRLTGFVLNED